MGHEQNYSVEKMIDTAIELGRIEIALKMKWVELAYNQTDDSDMVVFELLKLQKGN